MSEPLPSRYAASDVEARWIATWQEKGAFRPVDDGGSSEPFVVVIPPPNVTGALHMGHALNNTLQDVQVRFHRMRGHPTLWVPGTDHAGIATQSVVEREVAKEGTSRDEMGRDAFIERVYQWKEQYGGRIVEQLKRLGASCDWERERFTMDEGLSRAVRTAFVKLYEEGLIYQGERLINWCPALLTSLSDEEVETEEEDGHFWHLRYPVEGQPDRHLVVATTRPETMVGDTAVAVHPSDERYKDLVGKHVRLPLVDRLIPIIADEHADPEKGSGAVKITPAHDFNDFMVGERNDLPRLNVMNADATMNENAGPYAGLNRFDARKKIVADMDALGLLAQVEDRRIPMPRCYRSHDVVEPRLSKQWFVKMRPLLEPAAAAVKDGTVDIVPERYTRTYLDWVEQYRDWCISRQIWWGHRIPVWYDEDGTPVASMDDLEIGSAHPETGKPIVRQDEDVLDTWFSSQLWPFSVMGWPDETADLERFYPTSVLVTARDIIYFWVARMVMTGLHFMKKAPFHTVYINGTVLDEIGRRMSKSLGNGIDPLEMGDRYGMDAVRWTLVSLTTEGQDIKLAESRFEGGRNFVNKLWNASRFVLMNLEGKSGLGGAPAVTEPEDRWILSKLAELNEECSQALTEHRYHEASSRLYAFTWNVFCDWYLELTKARMNDESPEGAASKETAQAVLAHVLDALLKLLHPIIPFVTEEIREKLAAHLGGEAGLLTSADWPELRAGDRDPAAELEVERLIALVRAARTVRDRMGISWSKDLEFQVRAKDDGIAKSIEAIAERAKAMGRLSAVTVSVDLEKPAKASTVVEEGLEIFVPLEGLIDLDAERARLEKELKQIDGWITGANKKLGNAGFVAKAPPEVVEREKARVAELEEKRTAISANLSELS